MPIKNSFITLRLDREKQSSLFLSVIKNSFITLRLGNDEDGVSGFSTDGVSGKENATSERVPEVKRVGLVINDSIRRVSHWRCKSRDPFRKNGGNLPQTVIQSQKGYEIRSN